MEFPRFYFLSDEELLDILSYDKKSEIINQFVNKCFEGIEKIRFDLNEIISFFS